MKPMFSAGYAWCCIVLSVFAIVILSTIGALFSSGHETMVGSINDPELSEAKNVAHTIFGAVVVYAVFLVFCAGQAWLNSRQRGVQLQ
ncbi:hypothetical protein EX30DRAFT_316365 [Ascodesmis nigricans]|uniref:Uncharacterized protein n=1 Tax=Ascodesmis nigricans TaxID=341454 RepID=A0A4S2N5K8_9PEZI|nr:hypothetical protein EX30DRAFT_316365 [Ascodesmis nigricans]